MWRRALAAAVIALIASVAEAQWHASVAPPRASLPAVTVDFGYPGPYVPWTSAPITLHATAGDAPFDGYIGFSFRIDDRYNAGTPVICRMVLQPHQVWSFSTFARLRRGSGAVTDTPRQVFIEWFDHNAQRITAVNAGTPPWTLWRSQRLPLRVARAGETVSDRALGRTAIVMRPDALPDVAQWYAGFSDVIAPLDLWLDFPPRVREAIFGSGVHVILFGFARAGQQLDATTRTLLPVTFDPRPASFVAPWPYRGERAMPVATPASWQPKSGTEHVGTYIIESVAAAWSPEEAVVLAPIPAVTAVPIRLSAAFNQPANANQSSTEWPRPAQIARVYPAVLLSIVGLIVTVLGWVLVRRRQRTAFVAALIVIAAIPLAVRARIRPRTGEYVIDISRPVAAGVVDTLHLVNTYGPSPLAAPTSGTMPNSITGALDFFDLYEIRTSDTPTLMGIIKGPRDWEALVRWNERREVSDGARIRIHDRNAKEIAFDFDSPFPVSRIAARWQCGDAFCSGERTLPRTRSGTVTIESNHFLWQEDHAPEPWIDSPVSPTLNRLTATHVILTDEDRSSERIIDWQVPVADATKPPFRMWQLAHPDSNGVASYTFALPPALSPRATATVSLSGMSGPTEAVTISYAKGTITLQPSDNSAYRIPSAVLRDILDQGGIVNVSATLPTKPIVVGAGIEVSEKQP